MQASRAAVRAGRGRGLADLVGLAPAMALFGVFIVVPMLSLDMYQEAFQQNEFGYASVLAVVLGVFGVGLAFGLVRFSGFASMASQQEGAA